MQAKNDFQFQYVRDKRNRKVGVIAWQRDDNLGEVLIGWSRCNHKDVFSKQKALEIAHGRMVMAGIRLTPVNVEIPEDVQNVIRRVLSRRTVADKTPYIRPCKQETYDKLVAEEDYNLF